MKQPYKYVKDGNRHTWITVQCPVVELAYLRFSTAHNCWVSMISPKIGQDQSRAFTCTDFHRTVRETENYIDRCFIDGTYR